jgi:hypothetical protein
MKSVLTRGMAPPSLRDSAAVPATSVVSTAFQADVRGGAVPLERPRPICGCLRCARVRRRTGNLPGARCTT